MVFIGKILAISALLSAAIAFLGRAIAAVEPSSSAAIAAISLPVLIVAAALGWRGYVAPKE